jgi:putative aldouronate transport system substrate-binding protein
MRIRYLAAVAVLLALSCALAFASGAKEATSAAPAQVSLTYTSWEEGWEGPIEGKDEVIGEIIKRTGVNIALKRWIVTSEEDRKRQLALWTSTNDVPEFLLIPTDGYTVDLMNQYGDAGRLWEVTGPTAGMKLPADILAAEKANNKYYASRSTGKEYVMSGANWDPKWTQEVESAQEGMLIRKDWLDRAGLGYPKTPEEYYQALRAFKGKIGDVGGKPVIPLVLNESLGGADYIRRWFFDVTDRDGRFRQLADGSYTSLPDAQKLERYVVFMNRLFREGLLDPEAGTIKDSQYQEKMTSGRAGSTGTAWWNMNSYNDALQAQDPKALLVYFPMPKGEGVQSPVQQWIGPGAPSAFVFSKKATQEKLDAAFRVIDYMSTQEGVILGVFGIEGKHWEKDANGKLAYTKDFMDRTKGDWNAGAQIGVGYYSVGINQSIINPLKAISPTDLRPDMIESRKNLKGTIFTAFDPQGLVPAGPVETAKAPAIANAWRDLFISAVLAGSEDECRKIVRGWQQQWTSLGGPDIVKEKNDNMKKATK